MTSPVGTTLDVSWQVRAIAATDLDIRWDVAVVDVLNLGPAPGFQETITRRRASQLADDDGLPLPQRDWDQAAEMLIAGVAVQPESSREQTDTGWRTVTTGWVLITPPRRGDVDIQRGDRIIHAGRTLEVVADPERWPAITGGIDHVEAVLQLAPPWPGAGGDTTDGHLQAATQAASSAYGWRP